MPERASQELFLGVQPILDRNENLTAYELLFRSGHFNGAHIVDDVSASATVINHAFSELGVEAVLGKYTGFINLSAPLILSDVIELLPRNKVVLEILEHVKVTQPLVQRCQQLKQAGFTLALDDFTGGEEEFRPLLEVVDIVKVDVQHMDQATLRETTARLKQRRVKLLAEKLDTRAQVDRCLELGYELFQGYYFARPIVLTGKRLSHAEAALMRLLALALTDSDTRQIEELFDENLGLTPSLLALVNSAAAGASTRIASLGHAATVLGRSRLRGWLQLLLFTLSSAPQAEFPSPLLILAATRGKLMELIGRALRPAEREFHERAFMTGVVSLVPALLGLPMKEIVGPMPIAAQIKAALLDREAALGHMLGLTEALEESDLIGIEKALDLVPGLDHGQVIELQVEAMRWANAIGEPGNSGE
jgi:EAL and modified HD-GYP domain-containing signal transduction protein